MLHDLSITNFAIIDELHVSFEAGLNIISGETGAGKSILIGAVSLLLGDRAAADMIRTQADTATVEALFRIQDNARLKEKLAALGFPGGEELVIRRVISRAGKNRVQVNGQMATLANLVQISESLINICGQHEHQVILSADNHIDILDEFGGCLDARAAYEDAYRRYGEICGRIEKLEEMRRTRAEKADLLEFQLAEIRGLNPSAGEDEALADEKKVLLNVQKLASFAERAYALLYAENGCIGDQFKEVLAQVREIRKIDPGLKIDSADLESCQAILQDAALTLRDYAKRLVFDPERLAVVDERLDVLGRLKRKHGGSLEAVLARRREMEEELKRASGLEEDLADLIGEKEVLTGKLQEKALALSKLRGKAAAALKKAIDAKLCDLNMPNASFFVNFTKRCGPAVETYGPKGGDEIEFYLAANAGEEPKPLARIASGGELSRIVLALKNVLAQTGSVGTLVFDEVDSGIGGATAEIVGRKLKEISAHHQVICITHLPQIASFGGLHLRVAKQVAGGRTFTTVEEIDESQKIEEISRMLGGVDIPETARVHARAMLEAARAARVGADQRRSRHAEKSAHR
ncbi:MAG: DNA repair protein RecN [Smithellaceae bacterium]|nr:DNA repair protein RecN [Smithellaceae bacterium]NLX51104.1 DNA repair protein RecN [Deltaproteobacteria bacterium]